jgi:hypothetical protein
MWNFYDEGFLPFDYLIANGKKVSEYEYNVETVGYWRWNQVFIIVNTLKGGGITDGLSEVDGAIWDYLLENVFMSKKEIYVSEFNKEGHCREKMIGLITALVVLERSDIIERNVLNYANWTSIWIDCWTILDCISLIIIRQEKIQEMIDNSCANDLTLVFGLGGSDLVERTGYGSDNN